MTGVAEEIEGVAVVWGVLVPVFLVAVATPHLTMYEVIRGGLIALSLLPAYAAPAACAAFQFEVQAARKRGAASRPLPLRILSWLVIGGVMVLGCAGLVAGCIAAVGRE